MACGSQSTRKVREAHAPTRPTQRYKREALLKGALGKGGEPLPGFMKTPPENILTHTRQVTATPAHTDTHSHTLTHK